MSDRKFIRRAVEFGDGAKGSARQVHEIFEGELGEAGRPLGILYIWTREDRDDPGAVVFTFGGATFGTFSEALAASDAAREKEPANG